MAEIESAIFIRAIRQKNDHWFIIEWSDGKISNYRLSELQRYCPCARCCDEKTGKRLIDPSKIDDDIAASRILSVGDYALQIFFTKGCSKEFIHFDYSDKYIMIMKYKLLNEVVAKLRVRRFSGLFWPILHSFLGVNIRMLILTPRKECKIGQNNPENRRTLSFATTLNVFLFCLACIFLWSCSSSGTPSTMEIWAMPNGKLKVLSTTAMIDDIVSQIGKDHINHIPLITGAIDPHSYELVKGDDEKLSLATIIFYNGLGLEHGASLRYQIEHHRNAIGVGDLILERQPDLILYSGKEIDPHIWMDISLWSHIIDPIVETLSQADPEGKEFYQVNGQQLLEEMLEKHRNIYVGLQHVPEEKRFLVTSHDAFSYFTRAYLASPKETNRGQWQKRCDAPEGLAPDGQLSASDIQKIVDHLVKYQIQIVFPESNVSRDSLKKIVHACAQKGLVAQISNEALYGDAMGPTNSDADTYLKMIRHDANVLIEAWNPTLGN